MSFRISPKSEVLFGNHTSCQTGKRSVAFGCSKVLCLYDKGVKDAGVVDPIVENMEKAGLDVVHYGDVLPDPPDKMINDCGEKARLEKIDGIVGIGGGSTLDTAKAVNLLSTNPGAIQQYLGMGVSHQPGKPLILIPTTSGTGSEITHVAVVTNTKTNTKDGILGPATIANLAIVDPLLTLGLPSHITAATGMDTFAHAIEAYTTMDSTMMSDMLSEKAIDLVVRYLPRAVVDGHDIEARTNMSFACLIAGMSFNDAMPHFGHAFSHSLGAIHHIPHGVACALAMPGVIGIVTDLMPQKVRRVGELMGASLREGLSPQQLCDSVTDRIITFNKELGIPTLKELKVSEADLLPLARATTRDGCFFFMPKRLNTEAVLEIIRNAHAL